MFDLAQFSSWLVVFLLLIVMAVVATRSQQQDSDRWERLSAWAERHAKPDLDSDDDPIEAAELRQTLRLEKLYADLSRLRHLIATDTYMSATRQLGNRLAYQQLRQELANQREQPALVTVSSAGGFIPEINGPIGRDHHGPESIDISWR